MVQDIVIGPIPQVRFRVEATPTGFLLRDHARNNWVNGAPTDHYYYEMSSQYPENIKVDTEARAWANMPQVGYEILPPDEVLFVFGVDGTYFYARKPEVETVVHAFERGEQRCHIHTIDREVVMFDFEKLEKPIRFKAV